MMTNESTQSQLSLKDVVDLSTFQDLSDSFTRLTGISTAILDPLGEILVASGWQKLCTEFHRKCPATASRCLESDTVLAGQVAKGKKYAVYTCKNGLVDVAVPIIIGKIHVGNLFAGQFFFDPPDLDFFRKQAEKFGFDKELYLDALSKVPVFSTDKVRQAIGFLTDLTVILGNIGIDRRKLIEINQHLEERIRDRTTELQTGKQFLESVFNAIQDGISVLDKDLNILQVNKIMTQWYPSLQHSLGEKCHRIYHGRSEPCEICPSTQTLKTKKMERAEVPFISHDNVIGTLELFSYPIKDSFGEITGIVEYVRDITGRVQVEKEKELLIQDLQETLSQVKQLSGLLPICASCKKIRDDQGYWNQIEEYIRKRSEAKFSHGICPDCVRKLYPDLCLFKDK